MSEHISHAEEQSLRKALRREARQDWPEFSDALHRRIVAAVERRRMEIAAVPRRSASKTAQRLSFAATLTAACLMAAAALNWHPFERQTPTQATEQAVTGLTALLPIEKFENTSLDDFNAMILSKTVTTQSTALKNDTRLVAEVLLRRLPVDVEALTGGKERNL